MKGVVKWFSDGRGYGFIADQAGVEIFVHFSGINGEGYRTLEAGQAVEFDIEETDRGPKAVGVQVIED